MTSRKETFIHTAVEISGAKHSEYFAGVEVIAPAWKGECHL
jgi:hypothetical protein